MMRQRKGEERRGSTHDLFLSPKAAPIPRPRSLSLAFIPSSPPPFRFAFILFVAQDFSQQMHCAYPNAIISRGLRVLPPIAFDSIHWSCCWWWWKQKAINLRHWLKQIHKCACNAAKYMFIYLNKCMERETNKQKYCIKYETATGPINIAMHLYNKSRSLICFHLLLFYAFGIMYKLLS